MDPDQALANARAALAEYRSAGLNEWDAEQAANDLADAFEVLDGWLSKGGFTPKAWEHEKPGSHRLDFVNNRGE